MKRFLFFAFAFGLLSACQHDRPRNIEVQLYARYDQANQVLRAEAQFFENGGKTARKSLAFPSGATLVNLKMQEKNLPGGIVRYDGELNGPAKDKIAIRVDDPEFGKIELPVEVQALGPFKVGKTDCPPALCMDLTFEGQPLEKNERLIFIVTDAAQEAHSYEFAGLTAQNKVSLSGSQLAILKPGSMSAYLVRSKTSEENRSGMKVLSTIEFYGRPQKFDWPP